MSSAKGSRFFRGSSVCQCPRSNSAYCSRRTRALQQTKALKTADGPSLAIVDSQGQLGERCLKAIKEINLPYSEVILLASEEDAGAMQEFDGEQLTVQELQEDSFEGVDLALFIAEETDSIERFGPLALVSGATVGRCRLDEKNKLIVQEGFFEVVEDEQSEEAQQQQQQINGNDGKEAASPTS